MKPHVEAFFDSAAYTYSHVLSDPITGHSAIIDSVLDYDPASGHTSCKGVERLIAYVREQTLTVKWLLGTHVNADHLSAVQHLKRALFIPDYGTARCDFPSGDARKLFQSIEKVFELSDNTRLFMCHDYKAPGRDVHEHQGCSEVDFVSMRQARDTTLGGPTLILPSVQVNMQACQLHSAKCRRHLTRAVAYF